MRYNYRIEATHEASAIVILPDVNGESSEVSKIMLGLHQPVSSNGKHIV